MINGVFLFWTSDNLTRSIIKGESTPTLYTALLTTHLKSLHKLALPLLMVMGALCFGQTYKPTIHLNQENGLKQNTVRTISQDENGRIWIGTTAGLAVYTGQSLKEIPAVREIVLALNYRSPYLYCITIKGLYRIHTQTDSVESVDFAKTDYYDFDFKDEGIFFQSNDGKDSSFYDYDLHRLDWKDISTTVGEELKQVAFGAGFLEYGNNGAVYKAQVSVPISTTFSPVALKYQKNQLFVASQEGLFELKISSKVEPELRQFFIGERIECLFKDRNENLWVGTAGNGVFMIHRNALLSTYFPISTSENKKAYCWGFFEHDQSIYTATSIGLVRLPVMSQKTILEKMTLGLSCISAQSNGEVLMVGTASSGIHRIFEGKLEQIQFNPNRILDNTALHIINNEAGFLACTKASLIQFDKMGNQVISIPYETLGVSPYIMYLKSTEEGYLAASTTSVVYLDKELNLKKNIKKNNARVMTMPVDFQDQLWFTSMDAGLIKLEGDSIRIMDFPDQHLYTLYNHKDQTLWMSSGTAIYSYSSGKARSFTLENGFALGEYNQLGLWEDMEGWLYYSGVGGVYKMHPDSVSTMPAVPSLSIKWKSGPLPSEALKLEYDQSSLVFELEMIQIGDQNLFALDYKIDGEWLETAPKSTVALAAQYGHSEIIFRVRNVISEEERLFPLKIYRASPIWLKTWFKIVLAGLIILVIIGIISLIKFRTTKKLLKEKQAENKVAQERLRISRELHDNIGARLTHIISSLDVEVYSQGPVSTELENINSFARETMTQLRETIWAVGDHAIFLSEWLNRLKYYINQVNSMAITDVRIEHGTIEDVQMGSIQTINLYRIAQEAVNNAIKYAEATEVLLRLSTDQGIIRLTVSDNGRGFEEGSSHKGSGLKGMKIRAEEAGGNIEIQSAKGKGTTLKVKLPFD